MSEEKLYAVKNDEGKYWDFKDQDWGLNAVTLAAIAGEEGAKCVAHDHGGHVVAFVEEPKKVTVSQNEAKAIESLLNANAYIETLDPFRYLFTSRNKEDIKRLIKAFKNGYTVAKEKKYNVKVPHAEGWHFQKYSSASKLGPRNNWRPFPAKDIDSNMSKELFLFTESEIGHYGLQDCEKEEVTDDEK